MKLRHLFMVVGVLGAIGIVWLVYAGYERHESSKDRLEAARSQAKSLVDRYAALSGFEVVKPGPNHSHCGEAGGITLRRDYSCSIEASVIYTSRSQPNLDQVQRELTRELQRDNAKDVYHPSEIQITSMSADLETYGNWRSQYYLSVPHVREQPRVSVMVLKPHGIESYDPEYWGSNEASAVLKQVEGQDISDVYSMIVLISMGYDDCESMAWPCGLLLAQ